MTDPAPSCGPPTWLGIDVGSTSTKATVFDAAGTSLASGSRGYPIARPSPERAEQSADDWLDAVHAAVGAISEQCPLATVRGIGVTSQVDTHVLVDADFRPLLPALLWQDVRTAAAAEALNAELGAAGRLRGWGNDQPRAASDPVVRARWLAEHEPAAWAAARWLLLPKDLVVARLIEAPVADPLGSFPVVGADARYVPGIGHAPGLAERLAPLRAPEEPAGATLRPWHGIPAGTPVATGTMDAFGNVLGSGLAAPGDAMLVVGTSVIVAEVGVGGTTGPGVVTFAPYRGRLVHAGPTQSGGDSLRWWTDATGHPIEKVLAAAATAEPGAGGVVFAPHLLGERAPLWDDEVRGWFIGLHAGTGFAELSRAVLEGIAHSARELLEAVERAAGVAAGRVVVSGGGSRSRLWCQVLADVTGRALHRSAEKDTAVVGAATLAAAAVSEADPWETAVQLARCDLVLSPEAGTRQRHDAMHEVYRTSYAALHDVHARLRRLPEGS